MKNFVRVDALKVRPNLYTEFLKIFEERELKWTNNQICITSPLEFSDDTTIGTGSLQLDWDASYRDADQIVVPKREYVLAEEDFQFLCAQFYDTVFEEIYDELMGFCPVGRLRIMKMEPRTCLSWHKDDTDRIHYPMKTQPGCFMTIEEESKHLDQDHWWLTSTKNFYHTATNASLESRIHLVGCVLCP